MFQFDPAHQYLMPVHFGSYLPATDSVLYGDVTTMSITYVTDREILAKYLPEGFEIGKEALVTVFYSQNREIEWLAGGSYNIIGVTASVIFNGKVDYVVGDYCLVLWENLTDPILTGRELQGIPKIYASIEDHTITADQWQTVAHHWNHSIVNLSIEKVRSLPAENLTELRKALKKVNLMGWKYIPKTGALGAEVSHATLFPIASTINTAWMGKGEVRWHHLARQQNPTQYHIVNALASLPILEYRFTFITQGTTNLRIPSDPLRPLR